MNPGMMNPGMMNPNMMNPGMPNPNMIGGNPMNPSMMGGPFMEQNNFINTDLENRFSKIERQIKRLDARISRLENPYPQPSPYNNNGFTSEINTSFNSTSNML